MVGLDFLRLSSLKFRGNFSPLQFSEFAFPGNSFSFFKGLSTIGRIEYSDLHKQVQRSSQIGIWEKVLAVGGRRFSPRNVSGKVGKPLRRLGLAIKRSSVPKHFESRRAGNTRCCQDWGQPPKKVWVHPVDLFGKHSFLLASLKVGK